ncbi:hypothetical protein [Lujinxingia litoralis]|uniref:hypothetical protein n=1 Tax=Lujinxingia litoralis TaxID=2211119 RepID=UPI00131452D7|nr:hypothetical protein [Lujinxingia litoralis]
MATAYVEARSAPVVASEVRWRAAEGRRGCGRKKVVIVAEYIQALKRASIEQVDGL